MKKYEIALFDLDGTLSESGEGILDCVRMIFSEMNRPLPDEEELKRFIGPPMFDSLKRVGFSDEDAKLGVDIYRNKFIKHGIYKNRVYDGMKQVLETLKSSGVRLGVASTKYQVFTDRIIIMLELDKYFDVVAGANVIAGNKTGDDAPRSNKIEVMNHAIEVLRKTPRDRIVMVGDTKYDADGAAAVGCDFIGCLYGYGTREEMEKYFTSGTPMFVSAAAGITDLIC